MSRLMGDGLSGLPNVPPTPDAGQGGVNGHALPESPPVGQPAGRKSLCEQVIGVGDLRELQPPDPLIDGLVYHGEMAQLSGNPGSFKSFLSLAWACAVAAGLRSWEGHRITRPGPVVYIAAEGASGLWLRIAAWCQLNNVPPEHLDGRLFVLPTAAQLGSFADIADVVELTKSRGAVLVVMDTRHRMTTGLDENSAKEQGTAIRHCDLIREETGAAVLLVHHSSRTGTAGRGSSAWDGAVWSDLRIKAKAMTAEITCEKHKDAPCGCKHPYQMKPVTVDEQHMPGRDERQRQTLVAVADTGFVDQNALSRAELDVLEVIRTMSTKTGLTRAEIRDFAESEKGVSRASAYSAVARLFNKNRIVNIGTAKTERFVVADGMLDLDGRDD